MALMVNTLPIDAPELVVAPPVDDGERLTRGTRMNIALGAPAKRIEPLTAGILGELPL